MGLMIRIFALCCLALCSAYHTIAQSNFYEEEPQKFTGGLILGANFAQVDGDTYYGYHRFGINTGGIVYIHFTTRIGISMELLYTQKGSRGEAVIKSSNIGTFVAKYFMNLNYIEVPLTFHVIVHDIDCEAGISYARLINSGEWIQAGYPVLIDPVKNRFNNSDIEYIFGISRKLYKKLYANARFQYSAISIRPDERIPATFGYGNNGQLNNLLSFRLVYML